MSLYRTPTRRSPSRDRRHRGGRAGRSFSFASDVTSAVAFAQMTFDCSEMRCKNCQDMISTYFNNIFQLISDVHSFFGAGRSRGGRGDHGGADAHPGNRGDRGDRGDRGGRPGGDADGRRHGRRLAEGQSFAQGVGRFEAT